VGHIERERHAAEHDERSLDAVRHTVGILEEPYLDTDTRTDAPDLQEKWIQLGRDQYYMMGDNRGNSEDSRYYGRVYRRDILGMLIK
jgi:type IV secretory pathway protease TraF